jgi:hypothetical protein
MVAEMPLVATSIENRKQGMCRRLVSAIEEVKKLLILTENREVFSFYLVKTLLLFYSDLRQMLKLLKVKTLLLCSIPSLVDTWTSRFGFVPIEDGDKVMLSKLSLIYMPGTVLLKKDLSTISIESQGL